MWLWCQVHRPGMCTVKLHWSHFLGVGRCLLNCITGLLKSSPTGHFGFPTESTSSITVPKGMKSQDDQKQVEARILQLATVTDNSMLISCVNKHGSIRAQIIEAPQNNHKHICNQALYGNGFGIPLSWIACRSIQVSTSSWVLLRWMTDSLLDLVLEF